MEVVEWCASFYMLWQIMKVHAGLEVGVPFNKPGDTEVKRNPVSGFDDAPFECEDKVTEASKHCKLEPLTSGTL